MNKAILILLLAVTSSVGTIPDIEREALIALYNSTNGDNWTRNDNWLGPPGTEGSWYGITIKYKKVFLLNLNNNNLVGRIPPELGNIKSIGIDLSNNQLSGPIPPGLGDNPKKMLTMLILNNNQLSGPIPPEVANLAWLMRLDLSHNQLSGPIPPSLGAETC